MGWQHVAEGVSVRPGADGLPVKLWVVAVLSYGLGDILTTLVGLSTGSFVEASPLVIPLVEQYGVTALLWLKALVFGMTGALWWYTPFPHSLGVPLGLSVLGIAVTGWNTYLLVVFGMG